MFHCPPLAVGMCHVLEIVAVDEEIVAIMIPEEGVVTFDAYLLTCIQIFQNYSVYLTS